MLEINNNSYKFQAFKARRMADNLISYSLNTSFPVLWCFAVSPKIFQVLGTLQEERKGEKDNW